MNYKCVPTDWCKRFSFSTSFGRTVVESKQVYYTISKRIFRKTTHDIIETAFSKPLIRKFSHGIVCVVWDHPGRQNKIQLRKRNIVLISDNFVFLATFFSTRTQHEYIIHFHGYDYI